MDLTQFVSELTSTLKENERLKSKTSTLEKHNQAQRILIRRLMSEKIEKEQIIADLQCKLDAKSDQLEDMKIEMNLREEKIAVFKDNFVTVKLELEKLITQ